jgi:hypothetical protein
MKFQREQIQNLWPEITPLTEKHWREIAHYQDIELQPDMATYNRME